MIKRRLKYMLFLLMGVGVKSYAQQSIQFSQYSFTGLTVNPAYAGYKEDWTLNLVSRLQWTGIPGAPRTGAVSMDGLTDDIYKNVGLGFVVTADQLGPRTTTSGYFNYAYRLQLDEEDTRRVSFGLGFGVAQYMLDQSQLTATDGSDPVIGSGVATKISPDFRLGVFYNSPTFYIGGSVLNLLADADFKDNTTVVREARSFYITSGYMMPLTPDLDWKPSILIKEDFKGPTNIDLSTNFLLGKTLWLGAAYRTGIKTWNKSSLQGGLSNYDAIVGMVQYYVSDRFRIGYSYDYNISKLAGPQNGTHELSLSISFSRRKERILSPRYF
ncbi:type IX secretion system membrane protein PorP/SprF [Mucilaginibacter mali]|uniref:Type IX secretion system membrane protein PorP/SprF n=1 Tax=Mucilaginibacter mali TaxID=2740462 RepID=A0A7D4QAJ4_9SPHI|nr:type IX secretion system membrane protein PorP/SprF [Mucilaginibacter mali]QKJ32011.1 type IX secretion system membrane protein PorP/SprF [Mucilaginibacter mali]